MPFIRPFHPRRAFLPTSVLDEGCNRIIIMKMWDVSNKYTPSEQMIADFKSSKREGFLGLEIIIPWD